MNNIGVHKTHCCVKHGCKYGDPGCPVVNGLIEQDYPCEECMEEERELNDRIQSLRYKENTKKDFDYQLLAKQLAKQNNDTQMKFFKEFYSIVNKSNLNSKDFNSSMVNYNLTGVYY